MRVSILLSRPSAAVISILGACHVCRAAVSSKARRHAYFNCRSLSSILWAYHECRAAVVLELLKKEVDICRLQADIGKRVEDKISKDQRRYFLMVPLSPILSILVIAALQESFALKLTIGSYQLRR